MRRAEAAGAVEQRRELQIAVAMRAGQWGPARGVLLHEVRDDRLLKPLFEIQDVVREAEPRSHAARVIQVVERAAGSKMPAVRRTAVLCIQLHRQTDNVMTLLGEQGRGDGGVDASRHCDDDAHFQTRTGVRVRLRSFSTTPGSTAITRSISVSVLTAPRLNRSEFCVRCGGKPIAFSTWQGSSVPEEHAEPVDTATPSRSSAINSDSASVRSKLMFVVLGTRGERTPFNAVPATLRRMPSSRRSRSAVSRVPSESILAIASRAATPIPTIPATFSVPARRLRSCLPPVRGGWSRTPRRIHRAPTPFGP